MMRILANIIASFFPKKKWRRAVRNKLGGDKRRFNKRLARLEKCGAFQIDEINGVTVARGDTLNLGYVFDGDAIVIAEEILRDEEYNFDVSDNSIVIDIGMNIGYASLYFASMEKVEHVYGFEPFKPTFTQALFNLEINKNLSHKIHPYNYGLGDEDKELELDFSAKAPGQMSTVIPITDIHPSRKDDTTKESILIKEASSELDEIILGHKDKKIVLKCDTEGSEKEIFENLDRNGVLKKIDLVMLEYHFSYDKPVMELLKKNGFSIFKQKIISLDTGDFGMIRAIRTD